MADFLQLEGKAVLVMGVANKKSVAFHTGKVLREAGARVIWTCLNGSVREGLRKKIIPEEPLLTCNVERQDEIDHMAEEVGKLAQELGPIQGVVHSLAFANYSAVFAKGTGTIKATFSNSSGEWRVMGWRVDSSLLPALLTCKNCKNVSKSPAELCPTCGQSMGEKPR